MIFRTLVTFSPIAAIAAIKQKSSSARIAKLYLFFSDYKDRSDKKKKQACFSRRNKIPIRLQCCLIDPAGNNTKSETGILTMYVNLFFLKYYIAYASVLLSKFRNHPVVFLVIAVSFTTIIIVIRSITAYNYLSVVSSLLQDRFSVVTQRSFHWKRLCSRL